MADLADVESAIAQSITSALYPPGGGGPAISGISYRVFRGPATPTLLMQDVPSGLVDISVIAVSGTARDTTRWGTQSYPLPGKSTLAALNSGNSTTFSGSASAGDISGVLAGSTAFVHQPSAGDTAEMIAAALADLIRPTMICWLSQSTITVPGLNSIQGRVANAQGILLELGRQEQDFKIAIHANQPSIRDAIGAVLTQAIGATAFLQLQDGTSGRIRLKSEQNIDNDMAASVYQRDIVCTVEFAITSISYLQAMLFGNLTLDGVAITV